MKKTTHKIIVKAYQVRWKDSFQVIKKRLNKRIINTALHIHHIGSTSVVGLPSKPIIDIDIEIKEIKNFPLIKAQLEKLGYEHVGDQGVEDREVFKLRLWTCLPKHHLYVCVSGSSELKRHLAFRDYLIAHPKTKEAYGKLKLEAAKKHPYDMDAYLKMKGTLINDVYRELGLDEVKLR